jgi:uncharacterized membrane protein/ribosomal protein L40E
MSFESSKSKGRIATLLIVLLPILSAIVYVPLYVFRLSTSNVLYLSVVLSALSYVGYILFLVAMHGLSKVYNDAKIFKNSLYGFTASIVGAIAFTVSIYAFLIPILDQLTAYATSPGTVPPLSIVISFLQVMVFVWIGGSVLAAINGFFYRRAFYALAEKSGEGNFRTAGLLMILGGALTILFVGTLIVFIGWIFAAMGFFSMKPKPTQAYPLPPQEVPTQAIAQKKQCPNCGAENSIDAIYCSHCGNKAS